MLVTTEPRSRGPFVLAELVCRHRGIRTNGAAWRLKCTVTLQECCSSFRDTRLYVRQPLSGRCTPH